MSPPVSLDVVLKDLPRRGTLVKDRGYRQIWRLAHENKSYYLKFYPRAGSALKRLIRGSPAMREFLNLQRLQKAGIPAARAVGVLMGYRIGKQLGDLVVVDAVEPAIALDAFLNELKLRGEPIPDHLALARQIRQLVASLGRAGLGHNDLHLGNILLHDRQLVLLDGYAVRAGGLRMDDLLLLGHSVNRYATRADILRGWYQLGPGGKPPTQNPVAARQIRKFLERIHGENNYFGKLKFTEGADDSRIGADGNPAGAGGMSTVSGASPAAPSATPTMPGTSPAAVGPAPAASGQRSDVRAGAMSINGWTGVYFKSSKYPRRWAPASGMRVDAADWRRAWPPLIERIESGQLTPLKRSPSGDVWAGEVVLSSRPIFIVVKRPYKRYWYRYLNEIGRGNRARRAWFKAWNLVARNIPTAWPLLLMEKRTFGYVTDCLVIFERCAGPTLAEVDLESLGDDGRDKIFRRTGRVLRQIEQMGFAHFDAKASNWIVQPDEILGPRPILIDVDGIRHRQWTALGIRRLLRSMESHPQFTAADSLALCQGYAPFSPMRIRQMAPTKMPDATGVAAASSNAESGSITTAAYGESEPESPAPVAVKLESNSTSTAAGSAQMPYAQDSPVKPATPESPPPEPRRDNQQ